MDDRAKETIGDRLKRAREARGMSRRRLSLTAGLAQAHVGMIERGDVGEHVSASVMLKLAAALGVSSDWLVAGEGPMEDLSHPTKTGTEG